MEAERPREQICAGLEQVPWALGCDPGSCWKTEQRSDTI